MEVQGQILQPLCMLIHAHMCKQLSCSQARYCSMQQHATDSAFLRFPENWWGSERPSVSSHVVMVHWKLRFTPFWFWSLLFGRFYNLQIKLFHVQSWCWFPEEVQEEVVVRVLEMPITACPVPMLPIRWQVLWILDWESTVGKARYPTGIQHANFFIYIRNRI